MSSIVSNPNLPVSSSRSAPLSTFRIAPSRGWISLKLSEIWEYRELLYFLVWRDIKVRYKQTALGAGWAIIQPLMTMVVFSVFFGGLGKIPSDGIPYPIFSFAALVPWTFFANALNQSANSLVGSANLITKVYFPRMIIPAAAVGAGLVDLGISFIVLIPLMIYYGISVTWNFLMFPVVVLLTALLALGVGMWSSALNVKYRDVRFALPFLIQLWMFVSPVIYPTSFLPQRWRLLFAMNPMTGIIEGYRSALFGHSFNWKAIAVATVITVAVLVYASLTFRRMEKSFADIV